MNGKMKNIGEREMTRKKKLVHRDRYLPPSEVKITNNFTAKREDLCKKLGREWREIEPPLTEQEVAEVVARDWVALPSRDGGIEILRGRRPTGKSWVMSPTKKEREKAHRTRIEEMLAELANEGDRDER